MESEIDLLKLTFPKANQLPDSTEPNSSKVYFIPNSREGLGIDSMGELAVSFEFSKQFLNDEGNPAPYIHITQALEQAFNFTLWSWKQEKSNGTKKINVV